MQNQNSKNLGVNLADPTKNIHIVIPLQPVQGKEFRVTVERGRESSLVAIFVALGQHKPEEAQDIRAYAYVKNSGFCHSVVDSFTHSDLVQQAIMGVVANAHHYAYPLTRMGI